MFSLHFCNIVFFTLFLHVFCDDNSTSFYVNSKDGSNNEDCGTEQIPCRELQYLLKKTDSILNRNITIGLGNYSEGKIDILKGEVSIFNSESSDKGCLIRNNNDDYCFKVESAALSMEKVDFMLDWKQSVFPVGFILNNASFSLSCTRLAVQFEYVGKMLNEVHQMISAHISNVSIGNVNLSDILYWDNSQKLSSNEACDWSHGLIELNNCTSKIYSSKLSGISGALFMDKGSLELNDVQFSTNCYENSFFSRRPLRCVGDGIVYASGTYEHNGADDKGNYFDLRKCRAAGPSLTGKREPFFSPIITNVIASNSSDSNKYNLLVLIKNLLPCEVKLCIYGKSSEITILDFDSFNSSYAQIDIAKNIIPSTFNVSLQYPGANNTKKYSPRHEVDARYLAGNGGGLDRTTKVILIVVLSVSSALCVCGIVIVVSVVCFVKRSRKRKGYSGMSGYPVIKPVEINGECSGSTIVYQAASTIPGAHTDNCQSENANQTPNASICPDIELR